MDLATPETPTLIDEKAEEQRAREKQAALDAWIAAGLDEQIEKPKCEAANGCTQHAFWLLVKSCGHDHTVCAFHRDGLDRELSRRRRDSKIVVCVLHEKPRKIDARWVVLP
jgi:hypothetical protein